MPLEIVSPPEAVYEVVRSTLANLAAAGGFSIPGLQDADLAALELYAPHRWTVLGFDRIASANDLRSVADIKGWRFLMRKHTHVVADVEALEEGLGNYRFGQLNAGPFTAETDEAIQRADELEGRFVPAFLRVPALYVAALWLQNQDSDADLVMVMSPAPQDFTPFGPTRVDSFLGKLKSLAASRPPDKNIKHSRGA